jgi:hypothetical protein
MGPCSALSPPSGISWVPADPPTPSPPPWYQASNDVVLGLLADGAHAGGAGGDGEQLDLWTETEAHEVSISNKKRFPFDIG